MLKLFYPILLIAVIFSGCSSCNKDETDVDVSHIQVNLKSDRFDKDFLALAKGDSKDRYSSFLKIQNKYSGFFNFYVDEILAMNYSKDTSFALADSLAAFINSPYYKSVFDTTVIVYNNVDDLDLKLTEGFKHLRYYFPYMIVPQVVYYLNGPRAFTYGDSILAIGLDNYLGENFWFYSAVQPPIPKFLVRRLRKEYIVPNAMEVIGTNLFPFNDAGKKLIDEMIYKGKIIWLLQHALPHTPDSLLTGFSEKDLNWLNNNEPEVWKFYMKNNLLYETDPMVYKKYVNDAPNTSGMPPESPGNTGSWVGWRIVQQFMKKNQSYTLVQLMNENDAQKILELSKYKP